MKDTTYFCESGTNGHIYRLINKAMRNISIHKLGFYESVFSPEWELMEEEDKEMVVGVLLSEYGIGTKEFVDYCIEEKFHNN
ncbi:hypothetical protein [Peribacillus frigoritolerans]|uniref:hypothetical protein n=1 Tax=Peribacillus frigoritolerans TaxID=450367 RepID=UPI002282AEB4|nr:hypothetical protein [Peribacillus frigoritolerans]MCY9007171.1 hypothetical protein [Peribacillus frigoritolerans]